MNSLYISNLYESIHKAQLYETTGSLETTSNSHQTIILSQPCQGLPKASLEEGEKRGEQISSIMMGHRPRPSQQAFSEHANTSKKMLWSNQTEQQISGTERGSRRLCWTPGPAPPFASNGEFTAPFNTPLLPPSHTLHLVKTAQVNWSLAGLINTLIFQPGTGDSSCHGVCICVSLGLVL